MIALLQNISKSFAILKEAPVEESTSTEDIYNDQFFFFFLKKKKNGFFFLIFLFYK